MGVQQPKLQMKGAQPAFHFECIRPVIRPQERACAHYKTEPIKFAAMVAEQRLAEMNEEERARAAKAS